MSKKSLKRLQLTTNQRCVISQKSLRLRIRKLHSIEIKRYSVQHKEWCAVSKYRSDVHLKLLRKYTEILRKIIRDPCRNLKPLILFSLPALHTNYRCRELCRQEVTAKLSQYNENYFIQLIYTVTETNDVEQTLTICNIYCFLLQKGCTKRLIVTLYVHRLYCWI